MPKGIRTVALERSISGVCPAAEKLWDTSMNEYSCSEIGGQSNVAFHWTCPASTAHRYTKRVFEVVNTVLGGHNPCTYCNGRIVLPEDSVTTHYPEFASEWSTKGNRRPASQTMHTTTAKVRWDCPTCLGSWSAKIDERLAGLTCTKCSRAPKKTLHDHAAAGTAKILESSLAVKRPDLLDEWDTDANMPLTPEIIAVSSGIKVAWVCRTNNEHRWEAQVGNRTARNSKCPHCARRVSTPVASESLAVTHPELAREWDSERNELSVAEVRHSSMQVVWWKCDVAPDHRWKRQVNARAKGSKCPGCRGVQASVTNSVANNARAASMWHPILNSKTAHEVSATTTKPYWWQCPTHADHAWQAPVARIVSRGDGCTYCAGKKASSANSLAGKYPLIAAELDTVASNTTADQVVAHSHKRLHWRCSIEPSHTWEAVVKDRTLDKIGCPWCYVPSNSRREVDLACELQAVLGGGDWNATVAGESGKLWRCDYSNADLKVIVEYDGSFWHSTDERRMRDLDKTIDLREAGWLVIRACEKGLETLTDLDFTMASQWTVRHIAREVLGILEAQGVATPIAQAQYAKRGPGLGADAAEQLWNDLKALQVERDRINGREPRMRRRVGKQAVKGQFGQPKAEPVAS